MYDETEFGPVALEMSSQLKQAANKAQETLLNQEMDINKLLLAMTELSTSNASILGSAIATLEKQLNSRVDKIS